ncbi:MAG: citramalate synthase [Chloroflexi bacterium]|nr:citramalate synthase [Chloroflexota bacterium]|tara:strand:+ start:16145 stop:17734 length:1590 start_codon:yes stop_codon:yes gene_type:complete
MDYVKLYDTTLRDGTQMEGVSLSVHDKLKIAERLDHLGVHFIEGGWPGSNPKDDEFFQEAKNLKLSNADLVAFGSTCRAYVDPVDDLNIMALVNSGAQVITIVGKSSESQVTDVLEVPLEENLRMISESVAYLKSLGKRIIFDAEHFFDGYLVNSEYSLQCISAAAKAGAECIVLCDTNGGTLPVDIFSTVSLVSKSLGVDIGIHCHNDADVAVANTLAAVQAGASHVQGTINGYGERSGNANLLSVIANLKLKLGLDVISDEQLSLLTDIHRFTAEMANMPRDRYQPYVGESAFTHKGGLHASAVAKVEDSYQHIDPSVVGNLKHIVVSELAGRSNIAIKLQEEGLSEDVTKEQLGILLQVVKERESRGFQYEGAEASFRLLVRRSLSGYRPPFELVDFMVVMEKRRRQGQRNTTTDEDSLCEAMVKVSVDGEVKHTVAEGNGPVNALDQALRKGLLEFYPTLGNVELTDYKVRVVSQGPGGTGAVVRVLVESTDGATNWATIGASTNIIEASWQALADSLEYALLQR